jgi:DNA mismatch endonuclease, patch repair protein
MTSDRSWRLALPEPDAYRPRRSANYVDRAREQDEAAGGRNQRLIQLPGDRTALASVALRLLPRSRRIYAYLRWSDNGKTCERYICEVINAARDKNLRAAWCVAREKRLTDGSF